MYMYLHVHVYQGFMGKYSPFYPFPPEYMYVRTYFCKWTLFFGLSLGFGCVWRGILSLTPSPSLLIACRQWTLAPWLSQLPQPPYRRGMYRVQWNQSPMYVTTKYTCTCTYVWLVAAPGNVVKKEKPLC